MASSDSRVVAVVRVLEGSIARVAAKLVLDITAHLIKDTPIDTGWARSNWVPSIGQPVLQTSGSYESAKNGQLDFTPQAKGLADVASRYKLNLGAIFITNNVHYIVKLNEGSSSQAPAAYVQRAIEKGIRDNSV